jgi:hypothetical protein
MDESVRFKDAGPDFYKQIHDGVIALVPASELADEFAETRLDEGREVEVRLTPLAAEPKQVPLMEVTILGPEETEPKSYLNVLGVKLQYDAKRWLRASAVFPHGRADSPGLAIRPPISED